MNHDESEMPAVSQKILNSCSGSGDNDRYVEGFHRRRLVRQEQQRRGREYGKGKYALNPTTNEIYHVKLVYFPSPAHSLVSPRNQHSNHLLVFHSELTLFTRAIIVHLHRRFHCPPPLQSSFFNILDIGLNSTAPFLLLFQVPRGDSSESLQIILS